MDNNLSTEEKILQAAQEVFIREGYDGARMQHIADKAGINKALLHYYYRSKEKLFLEVFEKVFTGLLQQIFTLVESEQSLEKFLKVFFREHIGFLLKDPRLPAFIISEISLNPGLISVVFKKIHGQGIRRFSEMLKREKEKGTVDPAVDARQVLINILSLSIFPVSIHPVIGGILGLSEEETGDFIRQRMEILPAMVMASVQKDKNKNQQK